MASRTRHVFRWDLDKTYLRTEFDSVRDLVKSALETARDKQAYPGASALLRSLKQSTGHRICIVSGSPQQMQSVLSAKLRLDGIEYDEFVLKDNLRNLVRGRFRAMRAQIPYKLPVLLRSRLRVQADAPTETLFGDDAESDAIIYSLYADLAEGRVPLDELPRIFEADRAYPDQIEAAMALARRLEPRPGVVQRILIHLDRRSPTGQFAKFGRRLVPIYNYFQAALVLYADQVLTARQVLFVALEMLDHDEYQLSQLANSLQDLLMRGRIYRQDAARLALECSEAAAEGALGDRVELPPFDQIAWAFAVRVRDLGDAPPLEWPASSPQLDYVALVDGDHARRRASKRSI
jgi:hypothetical protein